MKHSRFDHYKTNRRKRKAFCLRSAAALFCACVLISITLIVATGARSVYIIVRKNLYFVCYQTVYREEVADSVSGVICSGGGAGYVLEYGKGYAVAYSLYLTRQDAVSVCENLKDGGQKADVLEFYVDKIFLPASASGAAGNVAAFFKLYYECIALLSKTADGFDAGRVNFSGARCALESCAGVLSTLSESLDEGNKAERKACLALKAEAESVVKTLKGYSEGVFSASDIRSVYVSMGDFYIKTAKKLQKK